MKGNGACRNPVHRNSSSSCPTEYGCADLCMAMGRSQKHHLSNIAGVAFAGTSALKMNGTGKEAHAQVLAVILTLPGAVGRQLMSSQRVFSFQVSAKADKIY